MALSSGPAGGLAGDLLPYQNQCSLRDVESNVAWATSREPPEGQAAGDVESVGPCGCACAILPIPLVVNGCYSMRGSFLTSEAPAFLHFSSHPNETRHLSKVYLIIDLVDQDQPHTFISKPALSSTLSHLENIIPMRSAPDRPF